jgi:hypothetical protein
MRTFTLLAILICLVATAFAVEPPMTKLRIEVKNLAGKPLERASVVVRFAGSRSVAKLGKKVITSWEVRTNQEGVAKIPELPQGNIRIQVIATGYQTFGATFEVTEPEKTIEIKLNPPQAQYSPQQ